eukprot:CAMPEP_0184670098 /NCGR_PEP_ID=MMETSP0308-20130426/80649_1 /TAXON_ID=38269 /ORGANISM="Gloeochaete witrockiana, Strain SAG 46.84" /LENGTH=100 /DNA_ID=CAMNT_0027116697 /DNA_START=181 /DNA_END=483 /DNA_ORIENTATION=+
MSYWTSAESARSATRAEATPGMEIRRPSMEATHEAQVMPCTRRHTVCKVSPAPATTSTSERGRRGLSERVSLGDEVESEAKEGVSKERRRMRADAGALST